MPQQLSCLTVQLYWTIIKYPNRAGRQRATEWGRSLSERQRAPLPPSLPPSFTRLSGYSQLFRTLLEDIPGTICFRQSTGRGACRKRGSQICAERWLSANALHVVKYRPPPALILICDVVHLTGEMKCCRRQQQPNNSARRECQISARCRDISLMKGLGNWSWCRWVERYQFTPPWFKSNGSRGSTTTGVQANVCVCLCVTELVSRWISRETN